MKKFLLIGFLFGCHEVYNNVKPKTRSEIIGDKVNQYLRKNANDPDSYKPITTYLKDSLTYMKELSDDINSYGFVDISSNNVFANEAKERWAALRRERDSLLKIKFKDFTKTYTFIHECRIKNGFGGLIKTSFKIVTDTALNIISIVEN